MYIISSLILFFSRYIIYFITLFITPLKGAEGIFNDYNSFIVLFQSISLFIFFRGLNIKSKHLLSFISFFAPLTFGIYLLSDHPIIRSILFQNLFNYENLLNTDFYPLNIVIVAFLIFLISSIIEYIRNIVAKSRIYLFIESMLNRLIGNVIILIKKLFLDFLKENE